jgi:hypothetical protein
MIFLNIMNKKNKVLQNLLFRIKFAPMFKHSLWAIGTTVLLILFSISCSTKLDINAPYKATAVVYGLLDINQPRQYIRIMKTFQNGSGNAYDYAKITDSLYFKNITVKLINVVNGSEIILRKDNSIPMKPGTFASDSNFIYYTDVLLDKYAAYNLLITDNDTKDTFQNESPVNLIDSITWKNPSRALVLPFEVKSDSLNGKEQYYPVSWKTAAYAYASDLMARIHYTDYTLNPQGQIIDSVKQILDWPIEPDIPTRNRSGGDAVSRNIAQNELFNFLLANIPVKPNVKRRAYSLDFRVSSSSEELSTYVRLNAPSFGVVQKNVTYTNIKNGLGIFSSRNTNEISGIPFSANMQSIMANAAPLKSLNFF